MNGKRHDAAPYWVILMDLVAINLALVLAYLLRYRLQWFKDVLYDAPYRAYLPFNLLFSVSVPLILLGDKAYTRWRGRPWLDHVYRIVSAVTITLMISLVLVFVFQPRVYSRLLLLEAGIMMMLFLSVDRLLAMYILARLRRRGIGVKRIVIVGAGEVGRRVMRSIVARPDLGYEVVGYMDDNPLKGKGEIGRFKGLGPIDNLPTIIENESVDEVIITLPWTYQRRIWEILQECRQRQVEARLVPDLFQLSLSRVEVSDLGGVPLVSVHEIAFSREELLIKRIMDVTISLLALLLGWPLFLLIAIAIKLDSPGPILFRQERVGKNHRHFTMYKFRSMYVGSDEEKDRLAAMNEADGPLFKIRNDPRRTRVGRFLRRTSLDELPQFFNVLRGEMSLVGPRPPVPEEVAQYQPWHEKRLAVPPGITGLWQVSGRSELTFDEMVLLDLYYIEHWSPWLDLAILLRTIPKVLIGEGAY